MGRGGASARGEGVGGASSLGGNVGGTLGGGSGWGKGAGRSGDGGLAHAERGGTAPGRPTRELLGLQPPLLTSLDKG